MISIVTAAVHTPPAVNKGLPTPSTALVPYVLDDIHSDRVGPSLRVVLCRRKKKGGGKKSTPILHRKAHQLVKAKDLEHSEEH